jgi:hypothetical protein
MKLKDKYWLDFSDIKSSARWNKLLLIFLIIEWVVNSAFHFDRNLTILENIKLFSKSGLFLFSVIFTVVVLLLAITTNTLAFVNTKKLQEYRYHFKKDIINSVRLAFPEIQNYVFYQKLSRNYFVNSKLFKKNFQEYQGDDWLKCNYNGIDYEFCELNVYNVFRTVFHGIFIVGYFPEGVDDQREKIAALLNEFMKTNNKKAVFSTAQEYLYIAIHLDTTYLECENEKQVLNVENEIKFTENILLLMRGIIDN